MSSVGKSIEIETESVFSGYLWLGKMGGLGCGGYEVWSFLVGNENVLKLIMVMVEQLCEYSESHSIVYYRWMNL